ncbi:hypothetical protein [Curtobacterium sp. MCBD17_003]|uniref:hypothetical protein n=1 Tax=Curtobacterium sp. MCBD17_003 TaxID=2175667 RepID=UPI000DA7A18B|nr:hypothetical protein [Curtobacterium sp. MCBD17_003]WIE54473.1 hypothetical protein DEI88_015345 [Curtobacterium sp. MCBD17_003]
MHTEDASRVPFAAAAAGALAAAGTVAVRAVRRGRPVHPHGVALRGRIDWYRRSEPSGIGWIDDGAADGQVVEARLSRGIGLPAVLPDIWGLAVRATTPGGPADLLLAATGLGLPDRWMLRPARTPDGLRFTSLVPYRGALGPVLVAARALPGPTLPSDPSASAAVLDEGSWVLELLHAEPLGVWHPFARLVLARDAGTTDTDTGTRFDPMLRPLPGSGTYPWTRALREPSYAVAREGLAGSASVPLGTTRPLPR